jgi:ParB family chromosome partitioning protein
MTDSVSIATAPSGDPGTPAVIVERDERTIRLGDLGIARENLRHGEPPDDDIPTLAATLKAAGQLQPLTVRPGRGRKEDPWMALDGRRRRLALGLAAGGRGDRRGLSGRCLCRDRSGAPGGGGPADQHRRPGPCRRRHRRHRPDAEIEADDRRHRAGARLRRDRDQTSGRARRSSAAALERFRLGRHDAKQARLLARLPDIQAEQEDARQAALDGQGFQEWRVIERLDDSRVTTRDRRCALVDPAPMAMPAGARRPISSAN